MVVEVSRELPVTHDELNKSVDIEQCKLLLFDVLGRHYGQSDCSNLLGDHMGDVYTIITEHLGECVLLMDWQYCCIFINTTHFYGSA